MALSPKPERTRMRLGGGGGGEKEKRVAVCGEGARAETGCADKEATPLMQATYLLQKAADTQELGARNVLKEMN